MSLSIKITGAGAGLVRLASEKGLEVSEKDGDMVVTIDSVTPEEALAKLSLLAGVLASVR